MLCLDVKDLPDGWTALRSVSVVECLSDEGRLMLALRVTEDAPAWVILGMLHAATDVTGADLLDGFIDEDDEDGETSSS